MFAGLIDNYTQQIIIFTGINVIAAFSFFAPFKTGQVSLGQAGFMAIGAYASAVFTQKFGFPFAVSLPCAALLAGVVGVVVGFPALRIKGIYLLLLTLGFGEIVSVIALSWDYVGGAQGYRNIPFNPRTLGYVLGVVVVLIIFFGRLERSSLGRAMDSIHQDETAAEVMGIDVVRIKLMAFGLGAAIAGLAGALYAARFGTIDANAGINSELNVVAAVVVGGVAIFGGSGSVYGAALGAVLLTTIGAALPVLGVNPFWQNVAKGALLVVAIVIQQRRSGQRAVGLPA